MDRRDIKSFAKTYLTNDRWRPVGVTFVGSMIMSVAPLFLGGPIIYGVHEYYLKSMKGQECSFDDLFVGFKQYGRTFVTYLLITLYTFLWTLIPFAGPFIAIVKGFGYSQSIFLLRDHPEMSAKEVIAKSVEMMNGYKASYFMLSLSFIGWFILDSFTYGILGILYVYPYQQFAICEFHERLRNK